jgi:hypothetical protein
MGQNVVYCCMVMQFTAGEFMSATAFHSVKLPANLIDQARSAAVVFRRSTAAQIEYWAVLGQAVEESGITVKEAKAVMTPVAELDELDLIEARFDTALQPGALAARMREVIASNHSKTNGTSARLLEPHSLTSIL